MMIVSISTLAVAAMLGQAPASTASDPDEAASRPFCPERTAWDGQVCAGPIPCAYGTVWDGAVGCAALPPAVDAEPPGARCLDAPARCRRDCDGGDGAACGALGLGHDDPDQRAQLLGLACTLGLPGACECARGDETSCSSLAGRFAAAGRTAEPGEASRRSDEGRGIRAFVVLRIGLGGTAFPVVGDRRDDPEGPVVGSRVRHTGGFGVALDADLNFVETRFFGLHLRGGGNVSGYTGYATAGHVGGLVWAGWHRIAPFLAYRSEWRRGKLDEYIDQGHVTGVARYRVDVLDFGARSCWGKARNYTRGGCVLLGPTWHRPDFIDGLGGPGAPRGHAWGAMFDLWASLGGAMGFGGHVEVAGRYPIASEPQGKIANIDTVKLVSVTAFIQAVFAFSLTGK